MNPFYPATFYLSCRLHVATSCRPEHPHSSDSALGMGIRTFSEEPCTPLLENAVRNQDLGTGVLTATLVSLCLGPSALKAGTSTGLCETAHVFGGEFTVILPTPAEHDQVHSCCSSTLVCCSFPSNEAPGSHDL